MAASISSLVASALLLLIALEGLAYMLRGMGVRGSPIRWTARSLTRTGGRLLRWALRQGFALLRWLIVSLSRLLWVGMVAWWACRRTNPVVFRTVGAVMVVIVAVGVAVAVL